MSATDIAKDIVRIATTASMGRDVIDLMEKRLSLLTDENSGLSLSLREAQSKITVLEAQNTQLAKQLSDLQPTTHGLHDDAIKVLKLLFDRNAEMSIPMLARALQLHPSVFATHIDALSERSFVRYSSYGMGEDGGGITIRKDGRAFIISNNLV